MIIYLELADYTLWEVILNGSFTRPTANGQNQNTHGQLTFEHDRPWKSMTIRPLARLICRVSIVNRPFARLAMCFNSRPFKGLVFVTVV